MEAHPGGGSTVDGPGDKPPPPGIAAAATPKAPAKGSTKRHPKEGSKPSKSPAVNPTGTRFQCPRCPKNFSRIENLTRHQANRELRYVAFFSCIISLTSRADDDVGKFACVICRKRFTRSDLLNRHRRIHGPQAESTKAHVTKSEYPVAGPSPSLPDDRQSASQDGSSSYSNQSPRSGYQADAQQPLGSYSAHVQDGYGQTVLQPIGPMVQNHLPQAQGLTSLMEAALAPQTFNFPSVENANPSLWDGFMRFGESPATYMGTYDADMSWTLDYLPSEHSPDYLMDQDMLNTFDDFGDYSYQAPKYEPPPIQDTGDADGEDEDTTDWPDKVERPDTPQRIPNRVVPVRVQSISWQSVLDEARSSGLSPATIRPVETFSDPLRDTLLMTLNGSNFRNEISRPEISEAIFPPSEVLDFFLRLYIRYIHPRFPVLHLPTFEIYNSSPLLLVAMMFLGSSHSNTDRGRFSRLFHEHLRIAIIRIQEVDKKYVCIPLSAYGYYSQFAASKC